MIVDWGYPDFFIAARRSPLRRAQLRHAHQPEPEHRAKARALQLTGIPLMRCVSITLLIAPEHYSSRRRENKQLAPRRPCRRALNQHQLAAAAESQLPALSDESLKHQHRRNDGQMLYRDYGMTPSSLLCPIKFPSPFGPVHPR